MAGIVKTFDGLARASVKTFNGLVSAALKTINGQDASSGTTYQFVETFEGTQVDSRGSAWYDNTGWVNGNAGNVGHYAVSPAPLAGSFSWLSTTFGTLGRNFVTTTSQSNVYFLINSSVLTANDSFVGIKDVSNADVAFVVWRTGNTMRATCGGVTSSEGGTMATNTTYQVWVEYVTGSGANATLKVYIAAAGAAKPAAAISMTNGGATTNGSQVTIAGADVAIFDNFVQDSTQVIGSNPIP